MNILFSLLFAELLLQKSGSFCIETAANSLCGAVVGSTKIIRGEQQNVTSKRESEAAHFDSYYVNQKD
jgi:hypothetical protein